MLPAVATICAVSATPGYAVAQPAPASATDEAPTVAEIPVTAPELVHRKQVGVDRNGQPIMVVSLTQNVSDADLDLTKPSDQTELRARIHSTAEQACKALEAKYPLNKIQSQPPGCIGTATQEAIAIADQLVAAANAK